MRKVYILALHLAFGGIEKAIISMANLFCSKYDVEIISVYNMPDSPAFPVDERVKIRYLLSDVPNREEWKNAVKSKNPLAIARESMRSVKILCDKKRELIKAIKEIDDGVIISTRHEDNVLLSKYASDRVIKIAQLHHDHRFETLYIDGFKNKYHRIDTLCMLTPGLRDEVMAMMDGENEHTNVIYMPNFLEHYPAEVKFSDRSKTVLAVGRLNSVKRFDLLISHFAELHKDFPDWNLRIVGDGEERQRLEALVRELQAEEYVTLTGRKDSGGVEEEMLKASVFAMTSSSEGFPFVLLEAQSCALPVVAYDVRIGPGFVITEAYDGYLSPEGDKDCFCMRLKELMSSEELRIEMGKRAVEHAALFSAEEVSKLWFSLIGE